MAKKLAPKQELVKWEEELAKAAVESAKNEKMGSGKFISIRAGQLSFGGADIQNNEMRVVILGDIKENQYYDEDFNADVPQVPACYAFGEDEDEMAPHEDAKDPQNETCKGCPQNVFGSAERGQGKACKNVRRIALMSESDLEGDIKKADIAYMKLPVMSVANWANYKKKTLGEVVKRPYWAVITRISVVPDPKSQFKVKFDFEEKIDDSKLFLPLRERSEQVMKDIDFPYVVVEREPPKKQVMKKRKF